MTSSDVRGGQGVSEAARTWLRAQVMDMGDCEDELVASLSKVISSEREKVREEAAQCADRVADMDAKTREFLGELGAGQIIAASCIASAIRSSSPKAAPTEEKSE